MQPGAAVLLQITSWTPHIDDDRVATGLTPTPAAPWHGGALTGLPPAAGYLRACRHFCRAWDGGRRRTRKLAHAGNDIFFFVHQIQTFVYPRLSTTFFSLKVAESEKIVLQYCIIDFNDKQV